MDCAQQRGELGGLFNFVMGVSSTSVLGWAIVVAMVCFTSNSFMWSYLHSNLVKLEDQIHILDLRLQAIQKNTSKAKGMSIIPTSPRIRPSFATTPAASLNSIAAYPDKNHGLIYGLWSNRTLPGNFAKRLHPCISVIPKKIVNITCTNLPTIKDKAFKPKTSYMVINLPRTGSSYLQEAMHSHPDVKVRGVITCFPGSYSEIS